VTRLLLPMLLALLPALAATAGAAEVSFRVSTREAWVGSPVTVEIQVDNASTIETPLLPEVDGAEIRLLPGERSSSFTSIVNGRVTTRQSRTFVVEVRPLREGPIAIPPIEVVADGRSWRSETIAVDARRSDAADLLQASVVAEPARLYLGESAVATLRIVVRPFSDEALGLALNADEMWSLVDLDRSEFGVFLGALRELAAQRRRPRGREIELDGRIHYQYDLTTRIQPVRAGPPDLGDLRIAMRYPTGIRVGRDFFGRPEYSLAGTRPISVAPEIAPIDVVPLPLDGRPASFTGAVGAFSIEATAAPTSVAVGDPITLSLRILDRSPQPQSLELLQAPPIAAQPDLAAAFRIPPDPLAGVVEGRSKTFTATLRPRSAAATEIPPIEFSWFDPIEERYRTATSRAIPLEVRETEALDLAQVLGARDAPRGPAVPVLDGGLHPDAVLDPTRLRNDLVTPRWRWLAVLLSPPLLAGLAVLLRRRSAFLAAHPGIVRANRARRTALRRLAKPDADAIATALCGYVADCVQAPDRSLTSREAIAELERRDLPEPMVARFRDLVATCERARFGGGSLDAPRLAREAAECIAELHRLRRLAPASAAARARIDGTGAAAALLSIALFCPAAPAATPPDPSVLLTRAEALQAEARRLALERPEEARTAHLAAAAELQLLLQLVGPHAALQYNLGNALLRGGETGPAILAYLQAQALDPSNDRIAANLAEARARVDDRPSRLDDESLAQRVASWRHLLPLPTRLAGAAGAWVLLWGLVAVRALTTTRRDRAVQAWRGAIAAAAAAAILLAATAAVDLLEQRRDPRGVVLRDGVVARAGSGEGFAPAFASPLAGGTEFRVVERRPAWLRVQLSDGRSGWIAQDAAGLVAR
jgi:tetratricopeptide (TPR) repeat protein